MSIVQSLEALLFVAGKPLTVEACAKALQTKKEDVTSALVILKQKYADAQSGIHIIEQGNEVQMVSAPAVSEVTRAYLKAEITGELTKPQLETLTVIAYMGPLSKPVIDQIRGVNCTLILRNLMIRGLLEEHAAQDEEPQYDVSIDFLKYCGLKSREELPEYQELRSKVAYGDGVPNEEKKS